MNKVLKTTGLFAGVLSVGLLAGACERRSDGTYEPSSAPVERAGRNVERDFDQAGRAVERESDQAARSAEREAAQGIGGGPTSMAFGEAISSIAQARCDHEQRCNNIGRGKDYATSGACLASVRRDFADDLNASECPAGVDQRELSECLQEVRNEDCGNPLDTLGRLAACRTSDLCRNVR